MYAIVNIQGQQFKVEKNQELYVHRITEDEGASLESSEVLLIDADGDVKVGAPNVSGASVKYKVLSHLKGDKVIVLQEESDAKVYPREKMATAQYFHQNSDRNPLIN